MLERIQAYVNTLVKKIRNRPKALISTTVLLLATVGIAFYLWNDVKASGSWKTVRGVGSQWRVILIEKESGIIEGTGSILSADRSIPFTATGFRTNRFISLKLNTENQKELVVFQGNFRGRNELSVEITVSGDDESKGENFTFPLFRE